MSWADRQHRVVQGRHDLEQSQQAWIIEQRKIIASKAPLFLNAIATGVEAEITKFNDGCSDQTNHIGFDRPPHGGFKATRTCYPAVFVSVGFDSDGIVCDVRKTPSSSDLPQKRLYHLDLSVSKWDGELYASLDGYSIWDVNRTAEFILQFLSENLRYPLGRVTAYSEK